MTEAAPVSVLIPSHGRPEALRQCLASLGRQRVPPAEVRVVLDGGDAAGVESLAAWAKRVLAGPTRLHVEAVAHRGYVPARRRLLAAARCRLCLSLNDDVVAGPGLVAAHARAHGQAPGDAVVTGPCAQLPAEEAGTAAHPATLLDRIAAETGLLFFDATAAAAAGRLTFRHVYGLNFSAPTAALRACGGWHDLPHTYGYDDLEIASRLIAAGASLRFAADAGVQHRHRVGFDALLRREEALGRAAWAYAGVNAAFTRDLLGLDCRSPAFLAFCREAVERGARDAERNREAFERLCRLPARTLPPGSPVLDELPGFWVPLKRWLWRRGLLEAAGGGGGA